MNSSAADIAYLEGFRQGTLSVWYLTARLYLSYVIIILLMATVGTLGVRLWVQSH